MGRFDARMGGTGRENVEILDPRHDKKTVTMRIDDDVLDFFRRGGAGYQSRMNAVLRAYVYARRQKKSRRGRRQYAAASP